MKIQNLFFNLITFIILLFSCNKNLPEDITITNTPIEDIEYKWWILKHRNFQDSGIYIYNEATATIELELDLPKNLQSPHAIAFDGKSLWVGGNGENESIYELHPKNGAILSEIKNVPTEALTVDDDYLYYANFNVIYKIEKDGSFVEKTLTKNTILNIPDIAINGNELYYLRHSEEEPLIRLNLNNDTEHHIFGIENNDSYCLSIFNNELITVGPLNEINHNYLNTGRLKLTNTTEIKGWITAIAPYYEINE